LAAPLTEPVNGVAKVTVALAATGPTELYVVVVTLEVM
jgi:hypothetical protein